MAMTQMKHLTEDDIMQEIDKAGGKIYFPQSKESLIKELKKVQEWQRERELKECVGCLKRVVAGRQTFKDTLVREP